MIFYVRFPDYSSSLILCDDEYRGTHERSHLDAACKIYSNVVNSLQIHSLNA